MKQIMMALAAGLTLAACSADETVAAYGGADRLWVLESLDGQPFTERATLQFGEDGQISGQAPCNRYFAQQTAPYPWFELGPIGATMMACPNLDADAVFFGALKAMTQSEVVGDVLRLNNDDGREMIFRGQDLPEN